MANLPKGSKKLLNAWAFYDWANSVYSLVISSAIFPIFYAALFSENVKGVDVFGIYLEKNPLIAYTTALAFLVVAFMSPFLSGIADYVGNKKNFMRIFCYLGAFSCMALYFFTLENIELSLLFYFLGLVGFWGSLVFYNSYLPDIAFPEQQDRVSAKGYSLGYIGSVILLLLCLILIMYHEVFGFESSALPTKISFVLTGIWWIVFAQYSFGFLPKGNQNKEKFDRTVWFNGFKELKKVYASLSENIKLKRYLFAFFVYSMAVQTVMLIATYFGEQEISWCPPDSSGCDMKTLGLIVSILLIQIVAVGGAILTSITSKKIGNIKTLIIINIIWVGICITAFFITTPNQFYITAGVVGLVMGGIQSLSRSTYSKFLPEETKDTTSYFSFYDVSEKIGIVFGMLIYGVINQVTDSMRNSVLFLILFFGTGVILLLRVPRNRHN